MQRLSQQALASLPGSIRRPGYDRAAMVVGHGHIGMGAFQRCHIGDFSEDMLKRRPGAWGIVGINLRPPLLAGLLGPQDGLYSRTLRQGDEAETRVIGAVQRVVDAGDAAGAEAAIAALAAPLLLVVTLTITEKGYCHVPATGRLDWSNPDLTRDRVGRGSPGTALGLLAAVFERRRAAGAPGLTVISCDNIPANGALLGAVLADFVAARSADLARWVEANVAFPSTMVDRIVPAATPDDIADASDRLGFRDEAAVVGEPFRQWVIEDRFVRDRPPWDLAGAQFVADVTPYELIKMRVLNAAQSTLSHLGALVGHSFSFEAVADPILAGLTRSMLERETATTLPEVADMPVAPYIATAFDRIANTAIRHRCHQIGTDGSQKLVQRLVNPLRERMATGHAPGLLALGVAGWLAYVLAGARRFGGRWAPEDPLAGRIIAIGDQTGDFAALSRALLGLDAVFGHDLTDSPAVPAIADHLRGLLSADPRGYLAVLLDAA